MIVITVLIILVILLLAGVWWTYRFIFYSPRSGQNNDLNLVLTPEFKYLSERITDMINDVRTIPYEKVSIQSFDGLTLAGRYYHVRDGAPVNICFHGYRGTPTRDFSGGSKVILERGHNLLMIEERAQCSSEGHTISFGINERIDCLNWIDYCLDRFGEDVEIILVGISMGAATVLMASELDLVPNVKGIIADCPYTDPLEIIELVGKDLFHFPKPAVKAAAVLAAEIFGHFDLKQSSAIEAVKNTSVPICLIHGDRDTLVPPEMSMRLHEANPSLTELHMFPGAGHGLSFLIDTDRYRKTVNEFAEKVLSRQEY